VTRLTSPNPQARGPYLANRAFLGQVVAKFPVNSPTCVSRPVVIRVGPGIVAFDARRLQRL